MTHKCSCRGYIKCVFNSFIQLTRAKALEVGTLPPIHVYNLDVVASFYKVTFSSLSVNTDVLYQISERIGKFKPRALF